MEYPEGAQDDPLCFTSAGGDQSDVIAAVDAEVLGAAETETAGGCEACKGDTNEADDPSLNWRLAIFNARINCSKLTGSAPQIFPSHTNSIAHKVNVRKTAC
jgi:hypothetical protein